MIHIAKTVVEARVERALHRGILHRHENAPILMCGYEHDAMRIE